MPRFVVLRHEMPAASGWPSHFDLMLEHQGALKTWALQEPPRPGEPIPAERLADHRLAYLDYQGPISGGRGSVTRWDQGTYEAILISPECWRIRLRGRQLVGTLEVIASPEGQAAWHCRYEPDRAIPTDSQMQR